MDDDTKIDYEQLSLALSHQNPSDLSIYCPSVLKNQRLWRHKSAPIMGKWAYLNDNYTSN